MTLDEWRLAQGLTLQAASAKFTTHAGRPISPSMIERWCYPPGDARRNVPRDENKELIDEVTGGAVSGESWYTPRRRGRATAVSVAAARRGHETRRRQRLAQRQAQNGARA